MNIKKIQKQLRLAKEPDSELLELLDGIEDRPAKSQQTMLKVSTPQMIQGILEDELTTQSVGELISQARKKNGVTPEQVGQILGVGKSRISQLEKQGANLELQTLARVAHALNYDVKIVFVPRQ